MKKAIFLFLLAAVALSHQALAYDFSAVAPSGQTLYYTIFFGKATVTYPYNNSNYWYGYTKPTGALTIPDSVTHNGYTYPVTSIGDYSFCECSSLVSVTIPSSVTSIGSYAFSNCTSLDSVIIPSTVWSIGVKSFANCTGLTSVVFNATNCQDLSYSNDNSNNRPFDGDTNITNFVIGNDVKRIPNYLCCGMKNITSIIIPDSVKSIGKYAFTGCYSLSSITIPNADTSIGDYAFASCISLPSITIPINVKSIGIKAFSNCIALTSIFFNARYCFYTDEFSYDNGIDNRPFYGDTNVTSFVFGNNVKHISAYLCYGMSKITSITIPDSVSNIGRGAFSKCNSITSVNYKATDCSLGGAYYNYNTFAYVKDNPFEYDTNITNFTIYNSVKKIPHWLCYGLKKINNIIIPDSVTSIGYLAFTSCSSLSSIFLPTSVTSIGNYAFAGCSNLSSVTIPSSVTYIGFNAFDECSNITSATVGNNTLSIASNDTSLGKVCIQIPSMSPYDYSLQIKAFDIVYKHHFYWSNGSTANPDTILLSGDSTIIAYFAPNTYTLNFQSNDTAMGIVNIVTTTSYYLDTTPCVTATALPHYHFTQWSDGSTENPRQFVFDEDQTYTALFAIDTHSVSLQVDNIAHGIVTGSGNYTYGTPITVSASPFSGFQFTHWSDGSTYNPYTFAVLSDKSLTAVFLADGEPWQDTVIVYDTTYVILHDTAYVNVPVHDTTYINIHDTTYITLTDTLINTIYDTIVNTQYDTIINTLYDTILLTDTLWMTQVDTLWLHDTLWLYDTIIIHDTIYITGEGIDGTNAPDIKVYVSQGQIVVEGANGNEVRLYDLNGRLLATKRDYYSVLYFSVPATGTYLIKAGNFPARKVVVVR